MFLQVIQVQELEIGKLRRDLGRIREQVDRMEQQKVPMPAKLEQTLARVVGEEEEERRWHRSGKSEIPRVKPSNFKGGGNLQI